MTVSRGQNFDLIRLSQHADWIEWQEREAEWACDWGVLSTACGIWAGVQTILLYVSSGRFQLIQASCISEHVPVISASVARHLTLCCSFFILTVMQNTKTDSLWSHEFTRCLTGMTLGIHTLLTETVTKAKLHALQIDTSKTWWLVLHCSFYSPSLSTQTVPKMHADSFIFFCFFCSLHNCETAGFPWAACCTSTAVFLRIEGRFSVCSSVSIFVHRPNECAVVRSNGDLRPIYVPFGLQGRTYWTF